MPCPSLRPFWGRGQLAALTVTLLWLPTGCAQGTAIEGAGAGDATTSGAGGSGDGGAGTGGRSSGNGTTASNSASTGSPTASSTSSGGGDGGASSSTGEGGGTTGTTTSTGTGTTTGGGGEAQACPSGQFVTGIDGQGKIACTAFAPAAIRAFASSCSLYLGNRDNCDGCTSVPAKWGYARTGQCANGLGANGTCTATSLGGTTLQMYGLNTDGDVNDDDKFYGSLHCTDGDTTTHQGPCAAFEFVTGIVGGVIQCSPASGAALPPIQDGCELYMGWRDSCDGCTTAPAKWGHAGDGGCMNGVGVNNSCVGAFLGGQTVNLIGINTDGDVDGNDKFHVGLSCATPAPDAAVVAGTCPAGQLVRGLLANGTLDCASPAPEAVVAFSTGCTGYFGWRDSCNGCTTAPAKWGSFRVGACANGTGADNTCVATTLGGTSVNLFGLNVDGDVGDDDKFYVGMLCQ